MNDDEKALKSRRKQAMLHILTLIFITLKLTHYIDWGWYFILFPSAIPGILYFIGFVMLCMADIVEKISYYIDRRKDISRKIALEKEIAEYNRKYISDK
jgi:hypothetical protein